MRLAVPHTLAHVRTCSSGMHVKDGESDIHIHYERSGGGGRKSNYGKEKKKRKELATYGAMALMRMPDSDCSRAAALVRPMTACFEAQ